MKHGETPQGRIPQHLIEEDPDLWMGLTMTIEDWLDLEEPIGIPWWEVRPEDVDEQ